MSHDENHSLNKSHTFKEICHLTVENTIPFYMYKSENTGITVCIAELDSPIISGYFNIVTETLDDDGLPYALKHLIFTGSKKYPYNGILNLWADRCLGSDINAYCRRDRTYFTMSAAGSEGFLSLMPKYLEHILDPELNDSAYLTEIHNVTSKGKHTGVVYCERREKERTVNEIIKNKMFRALYPGQCGYKSVIEGTTNNLRESTDNKKVKQFHKKFYRSDNLTVLIIGKIKHCDIFHSLLPLEEKIMSEKKKDRFTRPWQTAIKQLKKSGSNVDVDFPFSNEKCGEVYVAWRGPSATQVYDFYSCILLLVSLTLPCSPLMLELMKRNIYTKNHDEINPFFNIKCDTFLYSVSVLNIRFTKVPLKNIDHIKESIDKVLSNLYSNGLDIVAMRNLIQQLILIHQTRLENNPREVIASDVFNHIVYGNTTDDLKQRLNTIRNLEKLKTESEKYFLDLFKTYFVNAPMVVVKGKPSLVEYFKLQKEKKECVDTEQIAKKSIPTEILASVPIPNIDSITFYHITRYYTTDTFKQHHKLDVKNLPFFTYLNDINTNFFHLHVIIDTSSITENYSIYIPLLLKSFEVSLERRADVMKYNTQIGINNIERSHSASLKLQVELKNYEKSVKLLKELLYNTKITAETLKITIQRVTHNLNHQVLQEPIYLRNLMMQLLYKTNSHLFTCNEIRQFTLLKNIEERLNTVPGQKEVLAEIKSVRETLNSPKNMLIYMAVNVDKLTERFSDVYAPWNQCFSDFMTSEKIRPNVTAEWKLLKPFSSISSNGYILKLGELPKASFFYQTCQCINDFQDPDLPALIVCLKYFTQVEGPIYKVIKKKKFFCTCELYVTPDTGLLRLQLLTATNIVATYKKIKSIVKTHITDTKWDQHLYDSAKSLAILKYVNEVKSISHRIKVPLESYCRNLPYDYNYQMVRRISAVTMNDMSRVAASYVKLLFDPKNVKTIIMCKTSESAKIAKGFEGMKYNLEISSISA